jgi:tetratricopeptide (TPR) repeat protein
MKFLPRIIFVLAAAGFAAASSAQTQTMVIQNGKMAQTGGVQIQIGADLQLMFDAQQKVMKHDYRGAEASYSRAIAANGGNIEAYLQRAVTRRELGDVRGEASDASTAITLANAALQSSPNNALLFYQRGMGFRLLRDFPQAKQDLATAIRMSGKPSWETELRATELEEKTGR